MDQLGLSFEAKCGICGGYGGSSTRRVWTPGVIGIVHPCDPGGGTIPVDQPSESGGAGLWGWNSRPLAGGPWTRLKWDPFGPNRWFLLKPLPHG